jgi:hypothetical protein
VSGAGVARAEDFSMTLLSVFPGLPGVDKIEDF